MADADAGLGLERAMFSLRSNGSQTTRSPSVRSRNRGGRPPLPAILRRTRTINVALTEDEYAALRRKALAAALRPAEALRELALRGEVREATPRLNAQAWAHLGKFQGAVSRLLAIAGERIDEQDRALIESLHAEIRALRLALVRTA